MRYLVEKDRNRRNLFFRFEWKRLVLKSLLSSPFLSISNWNYLWRDFPKNSSPTRIRNRCILSGRAGSVYRRFRLSRICLREEANKGNLAGVYRSNW